MQKINWKLYFTLLGLASLGIVGIIPYLLKTTKGLLEQVPMPLPLVMVLQSVQLLILTSLFLFIGLLIWKRAGFQSVMIENWLNKGKITVKLPNYVLVSVGWGTAASFILMLISFLYEKLGFVAKTSEGAAMTFWEVILASFYGGFTEEIWMRLFLTTLFVFLISRILKQKENIHASIYVLAIFLAAIIFGVGHLQLLAATDLGYTVTSVSYVLLMNGAAGIVFGFLYWKKGIEAAFIAHFTADIWIHFLFPVLLGFTLT